MTGTLFDDICSKARAFAGVTPEREKVLHDLVPAVLPHLDVVTNHFYTHLQNIPRAAPLLEGRLPTLRRAHRAALEDMFRSAYDAAYVGRLYRIGQAHVRAHLPIEFMVGGSTTVAESLVPVVVDLCDGDAGRERITYEAVNAALGFGLMVMLESYQISNLLEVQAGSTHGPGPS